MKTLSFIIILSSILLFSCNRKKEASESDAVDMITIRTLGLAYLEENKLEEAEKEFLKLIDIQPKEILGHANLGLVYLRMGKYKEAEKRLKKAIKIAPEDADTRLILAKVLDMNGKKENAISELKKTLEFSPNHIKTLNTLADLYGTFTDNESTKQREHYLITVVENAPTNIVPQLNLIELLIRGNQPDKALAQLEEIQQQFPVFPKEAVEYFDTAFELLQKENCDEAISPFLIFHNYMKVTAAYQAGVLELKGPGGSLIGFPVITFDKQVLSKLSEEKSLLELIKFTDITSSSGLDKIVSPNQTKSISHFAVSDYDMDGDIDLYIGNSSGALLLNNKMGSFYDVAQEAGINHSDKEQSAKFADFDNDGNIDFYVITEGSNILYKNLGDGTFQNITKKANLEDNSSGNKALFFDFDHEGDLDLFVAKAGYNLLFRNNSDGTFSERAEKAGISGENINTRDAGFADFDDDGDIDLFVINEGSSNTLFSNQREGIFKDITKESGLQSDGKSGAVAIGDYNNDGFIDLFVSSLEGGNHELFRNTGNGNFEKDNNSAEAFDAIKNLKGLATKFLDFDNDGYLDLIITGESTAENNTGLFLFHNNGSGKFENVSHLLPNSTIEGKQIEIMDYNSDGDMDIVVAKLDGGIYLLRNDGGNTNHYIKMKLVGLRTGSAKNNYFGIGAKVEVRAGDLYQSTVVTEPYVHFGIGHRAKAEVVRIIWTNGVPQNIFFPGADQDLVEEQVLKGSCPFLYTWNGKEYTFVKDIIWRSALGMPMGIMAGETKYGFADASDDYIKIPGEFLKPKDGVYSMQVTTELWETIYFDQVQLVTVDHPDSVDIFVDEEFTPPPFPGLKIYQVADKNLPLSAKDLKGNDLMPVIAERDFNYISNFQSDKYQGLTEMHGIELDLGEIENTNELFLFLTGWIFPTDASINVALAQTDKIESIPPSVQIINKNGEWETIIPFLGFPMGKDKTVIADLSGKFPTSDHRVRIQTNMQIYWDHIFYSNCESDALIKTNELDPVAADFHYRGFSRSFRKGGRYGPHWFDYSTITTEPMWIDLVGNYTRYGDVLPLLTKSDSKYIISNAGDETTIEFKAEGYDELPEGWTRDFLIRGVGWVKDGDLNTAKGQTVLPLPFHGMKAYPPGKNDVYPTSEEYIKYMEEYNTREVTTDKLRKLVQK